MKINRNWIAAAIMALGAFAAPVTATTIQILSTADAFVAAGPSNNLGNNNYGGAGALAIAASGTAKGEQQSLIRYNLASTIASFDSEFGANNWMLKSITLRLNAAAPGNAIFNNPSVSGSFAVKWQSNDGWTEGTGNPGAPTTDGVTLNSLPTYIDNSLDESLGSFTSPSATSGLNAYSLSLSSGFASDLKAGGLVSLRLFAADTLISYVANARSNGGGANGPFLLVGSGCARTVGHGGAGPRRCGCGIAKEEAMKRSRLLLAMSLWLFAVAAFAHDPNAATQPATSKPATTGPAVRVAVIGGMADTGFWDAISERFTAATGIAVETVVTGNKDAIGPTFRKGGIDLITMHASDTIINLVADGWAMDPQPWVRNDLIIVGPKADPAGIKGLANPADALKNIVDTKSPFVVHSSLGAQDVLRNICQPAGIIMDGENTTVLLSDHQRQVLAIAAEKNAYTLIGRIPFRTGKLPNAGLVLMVEGDASLTRPYLVAVADPQNAKDAHVSEARRLAAFLRSADTQAFIATFGKGKLDDRPLFFPIPQLAGQVQAAAAGGIDRHRRCQNAAFPQGRRAGEASAKVDRYHRPFGQTRHVHRPVIEGRRQYRRRALGNHQMRGPNLQLALIAEAADGYEVVFSLAELDADSATARSLWHSSATASLSAKRTARIGSSSAMNRGRHAGCES